MRQLNLNNLGNSISNIDILNAQKEMGIVIPEPFINFLLIFNGGDMPRNLKERKFSIRDFLSIKKSADSLQGVFSAVSESFGGTKDWLPFGFDFGDWIYCICLKESKYGQIFLRRTDETDEEDAFEFIANSFDDFIENLRPE